MTVSLRDSLAYMDDTIPDTCEDCGGDGGSWDGGVWVPCSCVSERAERDARELRQAVQEHERRHGREPWDGVSW